MNVADLCKLDDPLVFFPVRHHSPAGARLAGELVRHMRPAAVLVEGPSDFNEQLDELFLDHELPIAIYSHVRDSDGGRHGAYYPYCDHSPEWQAMHAARDVGATVRFIDLPWADVNQLDRAVHRYADAELRRGRYVQHLCRRLGVDNFDDLWDRIVEVEPDLAIEDYMQRVHELCYHVRLWEEEVSECDRRREAFMAGEIRRALNERAAPVLVVTGGFHSSALFARIHEVDCPGTDDPAEHVRAKPGVGEERGIALTPYSYEQLDSFTGYDAGMPSPGFYHHVWRDRQNSRAFSPRPLLAQVVQSLRERNQTVSTADLIAVETTARALASLRGRDTVWRQDLLDGVIGALVKEELELGCESPFLEEILRVFRGDRRGRLSARAKLPPVVEDIRRQLHELNLVPQPRYREAEIDLLQPDDLLRSQVLHRLRILGIAGFKRIDGADFVARDDLSRLWEVWRISWSPDYDATSIEAARYGTTLVDAATQRLTERARQGVPGAAAAALILLDAALAGVRVITDELEQRLEKLVQQDSEFISVARAVGHLLFLYCYDEALGTAGSEQIGRLLRETFTRAAWLLESLGQVAGQEKDVLNGIRVLVESFERTEDRLELNGEEFTAVLSRVETDQDQVAAVRGAAVGALWALGAADAEQVGADLRLFSDPNQLGDFLTGLFCLGREVAQRRPELVKAIDSALMSFTGDDFLHALPSLRLAFTYFTPREKHHMLTTLFESQGIQEEQPLEALEVDAATAAAALALEEKLFEAMEKYGLWKTAP